MSDENAAMFDSVSKECYFEDDGHREPVFHATYKYIKALESEIESLRKERDHWKTEWLSEKDYADQMESIAARREDECKALKSDLDYERSLAEIKADFDSDEAKIYIDTHRVYIENLEERVKRLTDQLNTYMNKVDEYAEWHVIVARDIFGIDYDYMAWPSDSEIQEEIVARAKRMKEDNANLLKLARMMWTVMIAMENGSPLDDFMDELMHRMMQAGLHLRIVHEPSGKARAVEDIKWKEENDEQSQTV